jgi:hypothetical protein
MNMHRAARAAARIAGIGLAVLAAGCGGGGGGGGSSSDDLTASQPLRDSKLWLGGAVSTSIDANGDLAVNYDLFGSTWRVVATDVAVAATVDGIPGAAGGHCPDPTSFPLRAQHAWSETVANVTHVLVLADAGISRDTDVVICAHAVMQDDLGRVRELWAGFEAFPGCAEAKYFRWHVPSVDEEPPPPPGSTTIAAITQPLKQTIGTPFTIEGTGFGHAGDKVVVCFYDSSIGGTPYQGGVGDFATVFGHVMSATEIQGVAPTIVARLDLYGSVKVVFGNGIPTPTLGNVLWTAPPIVDAVETAPDSLPTGSPAFLAACSTTLRVLGVNFAPGAVVRLYDQAHGPSDGIGNGALADLQIAAELLTGETPEDPTQAGPLQVAIRVTNPDGQVGTFTAQDFVCETVGHYANVNATKTPGGNSGASVAVDPTNPHRYAVATASDEAGATGAVVLSLSVDDARTWAAKAIGGAVDGYAQGARSEAKVAFDRFGNLYVSYVHHDGRDAHVVLLQSADGGDTFPVVRTVCTAQTTLIGLVEIGTTVQRGHFLAVGPDGSDAAKEAVYVGWVEGATLVLDPILRLAVKASAARSAGKGDLSASLASTAVSDLPVAFPLSYEELDGAVGPDGELYIAWVLYETPLPALVPAVILADVDGDGLFGGSKHFGLDVRALTLGNVQFKEPIPPTNQGAGASPKMGVVRTGPFRGRMVLAYVDEDLEDDLILQDVDNLAILSVYTDDRLASFSRPIRVNDVDVGAQFQPALCVDPVRGDVHVAWYDTSADLTNRLTRRLASASFDGGMTWGKSLVVSDGESSCEAADGYGRSQGLAAWDRCVLAAWTDSSDATGDDPDDGAKTEVLTAHFQNGPE